MKSLIQLAVCLVALLSMGGAWAQVPDAQTDENAPETSSATAAPVAHVYVQTTSDLPGVSGEMVYAAAANGKLASVKGSPFLVPGQLESGNGKYLFDIGPYSVFTYQVASNGAIGKVVAATDTRNYGGSECGYPAVAGSVLDHTGKYLYVQLNSFGQCAAWQTYQVESDGSLLFIGDEEYFTNDEAGNPVSSSVPTISSNDKFGYGVFPVTTYDSDTYYCINFYQYCPQFSGFARDSSGTFSQNTRFSHSDPAAWPDFAYYPYVFSSPRADPDGHLAALVNQLDGEGDADFPQLASYTINATTGAISSSNAYSNMPYVSVGNVELGYPHTTPVTMQMSPSGRLLATAGHPGLEIFHFNGAAPITHYSAVLLPKIDIDQVEWDNDNHLYALSYDSNQLYVYTVTPTSIKEASGSPYKLPASPYGVKGLIVTR
jgi:hypothetical protein